MFQVSAFLRNWTRPCPGHVRFRYSEPLLPTLKPGLHAKASLDLNTYTHSEWFKGFRMQAWWAAQSACCQARWPECRVHGKNWLPSFLTLPSDFHIHTTEHTCTHTHVPMTLNKSKTTKFQKASKGDDFGPSEPIHSADRNVKCTHIIMVSQNK